MQREDAIIAYTDGACFGNPGPGGVGVVLKYKNNRKEISQGYKHTTNNRMEFLAVIYALEAIKPDSNLKVILHTDSALLVNTFTKGWAESWEKKGWRKAKNEIPKNLDLVQKIYELIKKRKVEFVWVKGHAGIPENERCDVLSKQAAESSDQLIDTVYMELINIF